jgi:hypothetical protein
MGVRGVGEQGHGLALIEINDSRRKPANATRIDQVTATQ